MSWPIPGTTTSRAAVKLCKSSTIGTETPSRSRSNTAAATYTADASALKTRINARLYNPGRGLYQISDTQTMGTAQDANALAILYGVASPSQSATILAKLKADLWTTPYGPLP